MHVVAAVVTRNGKALLCQRPERKHHGGLWEFPGGKTEPGEDNHAALVRELREELGVRVTQTGATLFTDTDAARGVTIEFIETHFDGEPQCLEHQALQWADPKLLGTLALAPADQRFALWWTTQA